MSLRSAAKDQARLAAKPRPMSLLLNWTYISSDDRRAHGRRAHGCPCAVIVMAAMLFRSLVFFNALVAVVRRCAFTLAALHQFMVLRRTSLLPYSAELYKDERIRDDLPRSAARESY